MACTKDMCPPSWIPSYTLLALSMQHVVHAYSTDATAVISKLFPQTAPGAVSEYKISKGMPPDPLVIYCASPPPLVVTWICP